MLVGQLSLNEDALRSTGPYDSLPGAHLYAHPAVFFRDCERAGVMSGAPSGSPTTGQKTAMWWRPRHMVARHI